MGNAENYNRYDFNPPKERKLTRKKRRAFERKMKKLKYQKIAKRIVEQKKTSDEKAKNH